MKKTIIILVAIILVASNCGGQQTINYKFEWDPSVQGDPPIYYVLCRMNQDSTIHTALDTAQLIYTDTLTLNLNPGIYLFGVYAYNQTGSSLENQEWPERMAFALDTIKGIIPTAPPILRIIKLGYINPPDTTQMGHRVDWIRDTSDLYKVYFGKIVYQNISTGQLREFWLRDCMIVKDNFAYVQLETGKNRIGVTGVFEDTIENMNYESLMSTVDILVN